MIRRGIGAALVALAIVTGCGTTRLQVIEPPVRPLATFGRIEVRDVELRARHPFHGEWESVARADAVVLTRELRAALSDLGGGGGEPLVLAARVIHYEAVFNDRKLVGGGSMASARIEIEADFLDTADHRVARIEASGESIQRGWGVASLGAARGRCVDALASFVRSQR